jgi:TonB family protein
MQLEPAGLQCQFQESLMRFAVAAVALFAVLSAFSVEAAPRAATGKWVVDFDDAQCVASRDFGTAAKPLMLVLKQPVAAEVIRVAVIRGGGRPNKFAEQVDAWIQVDKGRAIASSMIKFTVAGSGRQVFSTNIPLSQFAAVRKGQSLSISARPAFAETFQLANIEELMKVMDSCVADLAKVWNVGAYLKTPPAGSLKGLIRPEDYPGIAQKEMKSGRVSFILLINEQGRVADCSVIESSGVAALDAQSCAIVTERARFEPAIGIDGKPAKSTFKQRITWRIE